jgi:hypothetical protein
MWRSLNLAVTGLHKKFYRLHISLLERYQEVAKMLNSMINTPEKFCN